MTAQRAVIPAQAGIQAMPFVIPTQAGIQAMLLIIPAQAGIQGSLQLRLDSRLRGNDDVGGGMTTSAGE